MRAALPPPTGFRVWALERRGELMRKLPEALSQLIREFRKKKGGLVAVIAATGLAPHDNAFDGDSLRAEPWMLVHAGDGNLGADLEFPPGMKPHSPIGDLDSLVTRLSIGSVIQIEGGDPAGSNGIDLVHTRLVSAT